MLIQRSDFVDQLVEKHNYTKKAASAVVDDFIGMLLDNIESGNDVNFNGFGKFSLSECRARMYRDPTRDGVMVERPEHLRIRFHPGAKTKVAVKVCEARRGVIGG